MIKLVRQGFENKVRILGLLEKETKKFIELLEEAAKRGDQYLINASSLNAGQRIVMLREEFPEVYELFPLCNYFRTLGPEYKEMEDFAQKVYPLIDRPTQKARKSTIKLPEILFINFPDEDKDDK